MFCFDQFFLSCAWRVDLAGIVLFQVEAQRDPVGDSLFQFLVSFCACIVFLLLRNWIGLRECAASDPWIDLRDSGCVAGAFRFRKRP